MPSLTTASTRPTAAHNALCQLAERMGTEATTDDARALQAWALANDVDLDSATPDAFLAAIDAALAAPASQASAANVTFNFCANACDFGNFSGATQAAAQEAFADAAGYVSWAAMVAQAEETGGNSVEIREVLDNARLGPVVDPEEPAAVAAPTLNMVTLPGGTVDFLTDADRRFFPVIVPTTYVLTLAQPFTGSLLHIEVDADGVRTDDGRRFYPNLIASRMAADELHACEGGECPGEWLARVASHLGPVAAGAIFLA
jgi:hypothetical protein